MFLKNLHVTTIDSYQTRKREDGFCIDTVTRDIYIVTIIPSKELCYFDVVAESIHRQQPTRLSNKPFFSSEEIGLSEDVKHDVLVLKMKPPHYNQAIFCLGKASIRKTFTFEQADKSEDDDDLQFFRDYAKNEQGKPASSKELISLANWKINNTAQVAMSNTRIPYLCHFAGKISMTKGFCMVNKPLRDAVSLINVFQFEHFLKTGTILFSYEELLKLTRSEKKVLVSS